MSPSERPGRPPDYLLGVLRDGAVRFAYRSGVRALLAVPEGARVAPLPGTGAGSFPYPSTPRLLDDRLPPVEKVLERWRQPAPAGSMPPVDAGVGGVAAGSPRVPPAGGKPPTTAPRAVPPLAAPASGDPSGQPPAEPVARARPRQPQDAPVAGGGPSRSAEPLASPPDLLPPGADEPFLVQVPGVSPRPPAPRRSAPSAPESGSQQSPLAPGPPQTVPAPRLAADPGAAADRAAVPRRPDDSQPSPGPARPAPGTQGPTVATTAAPPGSPATAEPTLAAGVRRPAAGLPRQPVTTPSRAMPSPARRPVRAAAASGGPSDRPELVEELVPPAVAMARLPSVRPPAPSLPAADRAGPTSPAPVAVATAQPPAEVAVPTWVPAGRPLRAAYWERRLGHLRARVRR